jgi:hypothetical protein
VPHLQSMMSTFDACVWRPTRAPVSRLVTAFHHSPEIGQSLTQSVSKETEWTRRHYREDITPHWGTGPGNTLNQVYREANAFHAIRETESEFSWYGHTDLPLSRDTLFTCQRIRKKWLVNNVPASFCWTPKRDWKALNRIGLPINDM